MNVWELRSGRVDAFAPLVMTAANRARAGLLIADGRPKEWSNAPAVESTVIDCIDRESSVLREDGSIACEAFFADKVPSEPAVFKDPARVRSRIYVNRAAKEAIEKIVADTGLTGLEIGAPGSA